MIDVVLDLWKLLLTDVPAATDHETNRSDHCVRQYLSSYISDNLSAQPRGDISDNTVANQRHICLINQSDIEGKINMINECAREISASR